METIEYQKWICEACGYIYDEAVGDLDSGLAPGTRYDDIPDDWQCPLCGLTKSDLVILPTISSTTTKTINKLHKPSGGSATKCKGGDNYIVIVGAGIAAWSAIETIRKKDSVTPILMVTACDGMVYPKPAISTALAQGKTAQQLIEKTAENKAESLNVIVRTDTRVIKIDPVKKRITTAKGGIQYAKLILALGAHQRDLSMDGNAVSEIIKVNDLKGYQLLRAKLSDNIKHITILGAGLIGCEFAEDLSSVGYQVDIVDPSEAPLTNLLPYQMSQQLISYFQEKGVAWHFNAQMDSLDHQSNNMRATLSNGEALETDLVISAAGLIANTQLAKKAGLKIQKGIMVDENMQTSCNDIYALGDCAEVNNEIFAYIEPIRRQAASIAAHLNNESRPFNLKPPLIRVKIPGLPFTICPPKDVNGRVISLILKENSQHIDYYDGDNLVGFSLSGESSKNANLLYTKVVY